MTPSDPTPLPELEGLRDRLRGRVLAPGEPGYDEARRGWNALVDLRPGAIARCVGAADVLQAVGHAREHGVTPAVRSGGHDYAGRSSCDDGLLIDLSAMNGIRVDPEGRRAWVQPGATWGALDHETQAFGLAAPGPTVSTVGIGGAALGGGSGYLTRRHGLTLDNVLAADVVTADGRLLRASEEEHPDLFWALRGGGGNFGVVTSLELDLHRVGPELLAGQIVHRFEDAPEVLRFFRSFMAEAPDDLQCYPFFLKLPPLDVFPEELHGRVALDLVVACAGPLDEAEDALRPLRELGDPVFDGVAPQPFTVVQTTFDEGMPKGNRWYSRAHYLDALSDDAIEIVMEHVESMPGPFSVAYFGPLGGAAARVEPSATAFPHRDADLGIHILGGWTDPADDERCIDWVRSFHAAMVPHATGGVYVNLLAPDAGPDRVRAAYGPNHGRLRQIKAEYDPENLFRVNHNITPAG